MSAAVEVKWEIQVKWFALAAEAGSGFGAANRARLEGMLAPEELSEARARVAAHHRRGGATGAGGAATER